jgi:uncharacterized membrane protein YgcG
MKRSGTVLIFVIVWAAVLFGSFVIGICVREVRFHRARGVVEVVIVEETTTPKVVKRKVEILSDAEKLAQELALQAPAPRAGGGEQVANRPGGPGIEARQGAEGGRGNMRERMANMSEEERTQMRERMGGRRRGGGDRMQNMSEEDRARMEERRREMMERMENMSEEERSQMRERMGGRRSGGGEGGRGRPGGRQNREQ